MSEKIDYSKGIYDARQLGTGRMLILGVQHMFAMFGATVLVPLLTGLSVSTTLLCAGLGTLLFHLVTRGKVPAFLGSSFAYLGGFSIVAPMLADANGNLTVANTKMLPYACAAVAFSGLVYLVAGLLLSTFGIRRVMKFFPSTLSEAESAALLARIQAHQAEHGFTFWAMEDKNTGSLAGLTGLARVAFDAPFTPCVEVPGAASFAIRSPP